MKLGPAEPSAAPWQIITFADFVGRVLDADRVVPNRPWVVAVDGRGGGGKSTLAQRIQRSVPASAVVHTDDIAWHHSFFDWSELLIKGVMEPLYRGEAVRYQPPGWRKQGRAGAIEVAAGLDLVMIEGVGASRTELMPWIDRAVWVQSDMDEAERRGIARDGGTAEVRDFWYEWQAEEVVFLQAQRPWERAVVTVNGTPQQPYDQDSEIVIAAARP